MIWKHIHQGVAPTEYVKETRAARLPPSLPSIEILAIHLWKLFFRQVTFDADPLRRQRRRQRRRQQRLQGSHSNCQEGRLSHRQADCRL